MSLIKWERTRPYDNIRDEFTLDNVTLKEINATGTAQYAYGMTPDVLSYNDYYPFGQLVPNRHGASNQYRYGFQGQEKDDELKG